MRSVRAVIVCFVALVIGGLTMLGAASPSTADDPPSTAVSHRWTYDLATHKLVGTAGELPFAIKGGTGVVAEGLPAVKFTKATSLATYTGTDFSAPGAGDFTWTAELSMDRLNKKSTPNVAQFGLYNQPAQIKMQLNQKGVPQCLFHGTLGRRLVTAARTINDGGKKHVFSCWRSGATLGVTVDSASSSTTFDVGEIWPMGQPTMGNRTSTGSAKDQLFGKLWSLTITHA